MSQMMECETLATNTSMGSIGAVRSRQWAVSAGVVAMLVQVTDRPLWCIAGFAMLFPPFLLLAEWGGWRLRLGRQWSPDGLIAGLLPAWVAGMALVGSYTLIADRSGWMPLWFGLLFPAAEVAAAVVWSCWPKARPYK